MVDWTFITNHGAILILIARQGKVRAKDIALELGLTERSVLRIISDLVNEGYLKKEREGRNNRYRLNTELSLRRPELRDTTVQDLISVLSPKT